MKVQFDGNYISENLMETILRKNLMETILRKNLMETICFFNLMETILQLLLSVGTICWYNFMETIFRKNSMKLYVLSNLWRLSMVQVFFTTLQNIRLHWLSYMHGYDMVQIDGGECPASSESRLFAIERREMSERRGPSEDGDGHSP